MPFLRNNHVPPHKFRLTMATTAIDKGMPIEQVQYLLGHEKIDTTLHYTMVKQSNMRQDNDLKIIFQRLDGNPFSIELWFIHTKQIRFIFVNPSDKCISDIMNAKVCKNDNSYFWTTWDEFDTYDE